MLRANYLITLTSITQCLRGANSGAQQSNNSSARVRDCKIGMIANKERLRCDACTGMSTDPVQASWARCLILHDTLQDPMTIQDTQTKSHEGKIRCLKANT